MVYYNVDSFINNFGKKVYDLGLNPEYKANPAFYAILDEMKKLIVDMNIALETDTVVVEENDKDFSFDWRSVFGEQYSVAVQLSSFNRFRFMYVQSQELEKNHLDSYQQTTAIEYAVRFDPKTGYISVDKNGATVDNYKGKEQCVHGSWNDITIYDNKGVMIEREIRVFPEQMLSKEIEDVTVSDMLSIPRKSKPGDYWYNHYDTYSKLTRNTINTARLTDINNQKNTIYNAIVPLDAHSGLRDMRIYADKDYHPASIVIPSASKEEIQEWLAMEPNLVVREGLEVLAHNDYEYNSSDDEHFKRQGFDDTYRVR